MDVLKGRSTGKGRLTGMGLIIGINLVDGLGIFFSGFDQGVMSGVNVSPDYLASRSLYAWNIVANTSPRRS